MSRSFSVFIGSIVFFIITAASSFFIVDEREKVLVLQFGEVVRVKEDPGLFFKIPVIQEIVRYDDRILPVEASVIEVTPLDERRLVVDAFARWRIRDAVAFRKAVGAGNERSALEPLIEIVRAEIREVLGGVTSGVVLSADRVSLMNEIRDASRRRAVAIGIEIVDVRIIRADLPKENLEATYARMRAEREREAEDERARGREAAQRVRALADRTVVEITSEAEKEAEIIRGESDAERNAIFAEAFGRDPEFFAFYRSMRAYEKALQGGNSTLVISPDSEFFDYLKSGSGITPAE